MSFLIVLVVYTLNRENFLCIHNVCVFLLVVIITNLKWLSLGDIRGKRAMWPSLLRTLKKISRNWASWNPSSRLLAANSSVPECSRWLPASSLLSTLCYWSEYWKWYSLLSFTSTADTFKTTILQKYFFCQNGHFCRVFVKLSI